jgi:amino acid adenylation domain-containing protein
MSQDVIQGFRLSPQQKYLWSLQQDSGVYQAQSVFSLEGALDTAALAAALQRIVRRQEILRTTFEFLPGMRTPVQVVSEEATLDFRTVDLGGVQAELQPERLAELLREEAQSAHDFAQQATAHFCLIALGGERHLLVTSLPALCSDTRSLKNLFEEICLEYRASEPAPSGEDETVQYVQFSEWQHSLSEDEDGEAGREFWRAQALAATPFNILPLENSAGAAQSFAPLIHTVAVERELYASIVSAAEQTGVSLEIYLLAGWQTLISRLSLQPDVRLHVRFEGRVYEEMAGAHGLYERWIPVQGRCEDDYSLREILNRVESAVEEARQWQEYYVAGIDAGEALSQEERDGAAWPLGFDFQQWPEAQQCGQARFTVSRQHVCTERFKLRLSCVLADGRLKFDFHYDPSVYPASAIESLAERFASCLQNVTAAAETKISELEVIGANERRRLLVEWNSTSADFELNACFHQLFEAQAARAPGALALVCEETELSFRELNERSNQLAHYLRGLGVRPESRVGLCLERSPQMLVALLAILKAGGAYVPLDATQPPARLAFMLQDARVKVLLTQDAMLPLLPSHDAQPDAQPNAQPNAQMVSLERDRERIAAESIENLQTTVAPENLAYIIYTSGSTGKPKGAMITHRSAVNLWQALRREIYAAVETANSSAQTEKMQSATTCVSRKALRVSLNAPLAFDSSFKQVVQLLSGHTLCIVPEEVRRDGAEMLAYLTRQRVDALDCTPSQLRMLLDAGLGERAGEVVRLVLVGGEAIDEKLWERLGAQADKVTYYNVYGPTECTVDTTAQRVRSGEGATIGRPVANVRVYILDEHMKIVPVGMSGELFIGGEGVSRGYLHRAEMTAERFVPDAFSGRAGARLYRTGDIVKYRQDGCIEYLGRQDGQLKVRGSRIELGEIEAAVREHERVRECVVAAREDTTGDVRLVAYVVASAGVGVGGVGEAPTTRELRGFLQERLPEYMIPPAFVALDALPLTRNGKVDRQALPAPEQAGDEPEGAYVAPRTATEELLAGIWSHLLGVERLSVDGNFFELGGHSLLATQAVSQMRRAFGVEIPLRSLFEAPTVAGLAARIETALAGDTGEPMASVQRVSREGNLALSYAQQRLWFLQEMEPESAAYNIPRAFRIRGALDVKALEQTLSEIARRHEILRTTFRVVNGQPVQVVAEPQPLGLPVIELGHLPPDERGTEAQRMAADEGRKPFNLSTGPLMRTTLLRLAEQEFIALFTMHHIVFDAWSIGVLIEEIGALYNAFAQGQASPLKNLELQYADFAHWQRETLTGETLDAHLAYWRAQLADIANLELPTDRPRPPIQTYNGATRTVVLPPALSSQLKALSRREGATLYMTLLAAFKTLLQRYTGQDDISIGTPIANRNRSEIENLIGFFINTLVLRTDLSGDPTFRNLLGRVRETALSAYTHQDMPFEYLVEQLQPDRDMSRPPLFQVMFALLQNAPLEALQLQGVTLSPITLNSGTAKFDLLLFMEDTEEGLRAALEYNSDLFEAETINRLLANFETLLEDIAAGAERKLSELSVMTANERRQVVVEWNETADDYPQHLAVHQLFEAQVARSPQAIAAIFEGQQLSYDQLNRRANQLAAHLRSLGVGPEALVGICLGRSMAVPVCVLAVLKAGGAYVPLDPAYPKDRLAYMLEDSGVSVLLTQEWLLNKLPRHAARVICLDAERDALDAYPELTLEARTTADNIAYVTYTSGSTGKPKGIAMTQRPLLNLLTWQKRHTHLSPGARTLQFASLSFDVSFQDMFSTWNGGGTVTLIPEDVRRDIAGLSRTLSELSIERLFIPAVALQQLAEGFSEDGAFAAPLRKVIAGSEQLYITRAVARMFSENPDCTLHNEYGPSETHVVTSLDLAGEAAAWEERPTIGRPIANTQIYLLDRNLQPTPLGIPGELHIGGVSLARGYLNRPDVTAEKFVPDPFSAEPGGRMYRTGDLARFRPDGRIEFLGRMDHQVKIRGYRIELGEIETVVGEHEGVRECVAMVREDVAGDKRLVCYVVGEEGRSPTARELRSHLLDKLPEYMLPSVFVLLEKFPLTPNGKVDRKALPAPEQSRPDLADAFVEPRTSLERVLAGIWSQVLGVERVGIDDNFFELGGHSLLVTQLLSRVHEACQLKLPMRYLFEAPTVAGLAARMIQEENQPGDLEKIAALLEQLDALSEEDTQQLLAPEEQPSADYAP